MSHFSTMAGVNLQVEAWKPYPPPIMEDSNADGRNDIMELHKNFNDDESVMHFSAPRPVPTSGQNAVIPGRTQFTIVYKGNMCVYNGIPAEKVREIMLIAATFAKSAEMKSGVPITLITSPTSPQGNSNSNNLASPQSVSFPTEKNSICKLQEFPLARRQSLQRFLEKRRKRLGSKGPYSSSTTTVADNNFFSDNVPDFAPLNNQRNDFSSLLLSLEGN